MRKWQTIGILKTSRGSDKYREARHRFCFRRHAFPPPRRITVFPTVAVRNRRAPAAQGGPGPARPNALPMAPGRPRARVDPAGRRPQRPVEKARAQRGSGLHGPSARCDVGLALQRHGRGQPNALRLASPKRARSAPHMRATDLPGNGHAHARQTPRARATRAPGTRAHGPSTEVDGAAARPGSNLPVWQAGHQLEADAVAPSSVADSGRSPPLLATADAASGVEAAALGGTPARHPGSSSARVRERRWAGTSEADRAEGYGRHRRLPAHFRLIRWRRPLGCGCMGV